MRTLDFLARNLVHSLVVVAVACTSAMGDEAGRPGSTEAEQKNGFSELHLAAMRGDVAAVGKLLDSGVGANPRQAEFRGTPLQYAAAAGHVKVVERLLEHEAEVDAVDANGRTPLIWAAMKGQAEAARLLLDANANIGAANDGGWTPLHYSMSYGHEATTKLLLDRGASKELVNRQGKTPLDVKGTNVEAKED